MEGFYLKFYLTTNHFKWILHLEPGQFWTWKVW